MKNGKDSPLIVVHGSRFVRDELCRWLARRFGVDPLPCENGSMLRDVLDELAPGIVLVDRRIACDPGSAVSELASIYQQAPFVVLDERCEATTRAKYQSMGLGGCVSSADLESYLEKHLLSNETRHERPAESEPALVGGEPAT